MKAAIWIAVGLVLQACAHENMNNLNQEVSAQPVRQMHGGVAAKGLEAINASNLTPEQKELLKKIHTRMIAETFDNQEETSKLKGVLFETITKTPYDAKKVEMIKKRLVALNDQKLNNMFGALKEVEKVIGYSKPEEKQDIYQGIFFRDEYPDMPASR
jgi:hypothetical protein